MEFNTARTLAFDLLALHGLRLPIRWSTAKRQLGAIKFKNKVAVELVLSKVFIAANEEAAVKDLILHEIAHALVGCENEHNHVWKAKCREIGARPEQYAKLADSNVLPTHQVKCTQCECVYKNLFAASRKDYSQYLCGRCPNNGGTIKCVPFWNSVEDELRKLISA
jgi:predicted SprT family Zn-dependent metalloprotease